MAVPGARRADRFRFARRVDGAEICRPDLWQRLVNVQTSILVICTSAAHDECHARGMRSTPR